MAPITQAEPFKVSEMAAAISYKTPLAFAYHLVENVNDFPTLARLSATCKTFKGLIDGRVKLRKKLFNNLEQDPQSTEFVTCGIDDECWCNLFLKEYNEVVSPTTPPGKPAIFEYCPNFDGSAWLPCYGCYKIKKTHDFGHNHQDGCFDLLGCRALERRCSACWTEARKSGTQIVVDPDGVLIMQDEQYWVVERARAGRGKLVREMIKSNDSDTNAYSEENAKRGQLEWMLSICEQHGCFGCN